MSPLKAVVEFKDFEVAKNFSIICNGKMMIRDYPVVVELDMSLYKNPNEFKHKDNSPCNILIFRGLDPLTTEDDIRTELSALTTDKISDVRLIKEKHSTMSRGFCFVEMSTTEAATNLLKSISKIKPVFCIKSRKIAAGFARSTNPNINNDPSTKNVASNAIAAAQASRMSEKLIPVVDKNSTVQQSASVGNFQYDEKTGYYYDPSTGYCYNPVNGLYYYWSAEGNQYIVFQSKNTESDQGKSKEKVHKVAKISESKKIIKNMENWAKKVNENSKSKHVVIVQSNSESNQENDDELLEKNEYVDLNLVACLLCQRKFTSKSILVKHLKASDLHKVHIFVIFVKI